MKKTATSLLALSTLSLSIVAVAGCGGGSSNAGASGKGDTAGTGGAGGAGGAPGTGGSGGAGMAGEPIDAPPETWTWVDFPESRCASGTPTGMAVRIHPGSDRLVIFLEGGGSCTTGNQCFGPSPSAANTAGYGADEFKAETKHEKLTILQPDPGSGNPFAGANMVFVPYCTGDLHAGTKMQTLTMKDGTTRDAHFWGGKDLDLFLDRLVPTFPGMARVYLAGGSAGAGGTLLNYKKVRDAFAIRVDTVNDSGPPFATGEAAFAASAELWGLEQPSGCSTCVDAFTTFQFNRSVEPASRSALMSFQYDDTIAGNNDIPLADFPAALQDLAADLAGDPNVALFVAKNPIDKPLHVIVTKGTDAELTAANLAWLTKMAKDEAWEGMIYP